MFMAVVNYPIGQGAMMILSNQDFQITKKTPVNIVGPFVLYDFRFMLELAPRDLCAGETIIPITTV